MLDLEPEEQEETPGSLQQEYIDLEMYDNKYYTCDSWSDGEGLFALTDFNNGEDCKGDPSHYACIHKVRVLVDKSAFE